MMIDRVEFMKFFPKLIHWVVNESNKYRDAYICCNASERHSSEMRAIIEKMLMIDNIDLGGTGFDPVPTPVPLPVHEIREIANQTRVTYLMNKIHQYRTNPKELDKLFD